MATNDGGPAFPRAEGDNSLETDGMSLRDYFAGQALVGFMCNRKLMDEIDGEAGRNSLSGEELVAVAAYSFADAMIAQREQD